MMTIGELQQQMVNVWAALLAKLSFAELPQAATKEKEHFELVEEARLEWQAALSHFNQVTDPDLVDFAIYAMEAAECKYTYLLKKARQDGYRLPGRIDALRERRATNA